MSVDRRTELREATFLILFRMDFYPKEEMEEQVKDFFEGEDGFTEAERQYIGDKVISIAEKLDEIDQVLDEYSIGWKVKRMSKVDLTILRLAVWEILYNPDVPANVSVSEALELTERYSDPEDKPFVNGILGAVVREHQT